MNLIQKIKDTNLPYIIAEVGSNYKSIEDLLKSIELAKLAGADAVKFQYFTPRDLYGPFEADVHYSDMIPVENLKAYSSQVGIDFLCSAFSPESVKLLDPLVSAHKIASSEMSHIRLLEAVKETKKPLILSTGGHHIGSINQAVEFMGEDYPLILMHCNLKYPTKYVDLKKLDAVANFKGLVGYSDHTTSIDAVPVFMTKVVGVRVYEKHFNPFDYADTPDAPHSLSLKEFQVMCSLLKETKVIDYTEENEGRLMHIRRIIATKDLKAGDELKEGVNMGIYRSKRVDDKGMSPFTIGKFEGKKLKRDVSLGEGLSLNDIDF